MTHPCVAKQPDHGLRETKTLHEVDSPPTESTCCSCRCVCVCVCVVCTKAGKHTSKQPPSIMCVPLDQSRWEIPKHLFHTRDCPFQGMCGVGKQMHLRTLILCHSTAPPGEEGGVDHLHAHTHTHAHTHAFMHTNMHTLSTYGRCEAPIAGFSSSKFTVSLVCCHSI